MRIICACGHDDVGHVNDGPCMAGDCDCPALVTTSGGPGAAELAARRMYGDEAYERHQRRADDLWDQQYAQAVWLSVRMQHDAEARSAQAAVWSVVYWLLLIGGPVLIGTAIWAVVR